MNTNKIKIAIGSGIVLGAAAVLACGPDFPMQLLDDRAGTLKATPSNSFAFEAAHLVDAKDDLTAVENVGYPGWREENPRSPQALERGDLLPDQVDRLKAMRAERDGDAAYALGTGLPEAVRLYTAGAQDYRAARGGSEMGGPIAPMQPELALRAQRRFEAVLALSKNEAAPRAVWAAYMLGQTHANAIEAAGSDTAEERRQAVAAYERTRALAVAGAPDPWGLAVSSYGEQARLSLAGGEGLCSYQDFDQARSCVSSITSADLKRAIHLYAEQAARGSRLAENSLRYIATWALGDSARTAKIIDDPVSQKLLVTYALARVGDIVNGDPQSASDYSGGYGGTIGSGYPDAGRGASSTKANPALVSLVNALKKRGLENAAGADRLAALAYRIGRYDIAETLAARQTTALAGWVRAKLALRRGDVEGAAKAYADAIKGFPQVDASVERASLGLIKGEQGVLALSRGQYVEALDQFYQASNTSNGRGQSDGDGGYADYAEDMAYVAERVLTADELKAYVDAHAPASPAPKTSDPGTGDLAKHFEWLAANPRQLSDRLRMILARRLVREGRVDAALPYFPDDNDSRFVVTEYVDGKEQPVKWRVRAKAKEYGEALAQAQSAWRSVTRADALYRAAVIARWQGMEIMGYEQGPDVAEYGGGYPWGGGRYHSDYDPGTGKKIEAPQTPEARAQADLKGEFITEDERKRYAASEAKPYKRFHYRYVAAQYITQAADNLPPRSQAFAAVLCRGTEFLFYDEQWAGDFYKRYVKEGAAVPFSADFGQQCVEPDFAAASRFPYVQAWRKTRSWVAQHRKMTAAGSIGVVLLVGVGAIAWRRRRRSAAQASIQSTTQGAE